MNHSEIIRLLGGASALAARLGVPRVRVDRWSSRERIPSQYWSDLEGIHGDVNLAVLAAGNRPRKAPDRAGAAS